MRLFVAVFPPDEVSRDLRQRLAPDARLTPVERWHVTLAFIGEVAAGRLPEVEQALDAVAVPKGIELRLRGAGRFGSAVHWVGVEGALAPLNVDIRRRLAAAGLPYDERPFTPHLTVAYADDPRIGPALDGYAGPVWMVDEMVLVRSDRDRGYTRLRAW